MGRFADAKKRLQASVKANNPFGQVFMAMTLAKLGRTDEAKAMLQIVEEWMKAVPTQGEARTNLDAQAWDYRLEFETSDRRSQRDAWAPRARIAAVLPAAAYPIAVSDITKAPRRLVPCPMMPPTTETAHVLMTDRVGYSLVPIEQRPALDQELLEAVQSCPSLVGLAPGACIRLDSGDGVSLVFFADPVRAMQAALHVFETVARNAASSLDAKNANHKVNVSGLSARCRARTAPGLS